ncbi:MAG: hypothetical protein H7Y11_07650, partial [Armatimonadetes bacterium]|nr:hypothetical protein [Anaerolineae bacterium]
AIRDIFQFSRAFGSLWRGFIELTGLARLFRRSDEPAFVRQAFEKHKVFEPLTQLPEVVDKLGPHLEGRDLQDIDDLVKYSAREIAALPETIREKVIGTPQAPTQYDRRPIQDARPELEKLEDAARVVETDQMTQAIRNTLLYLGLWELLLLLIGIILLLTGIFGSRPESIITVVLILLGLGILGFVSLPIAGRVISNRYANRLLKLQSQYIETLTKAADRQIEYGMRLRRDAISPLTRLIDAQTQIQTEQLTRLQFAEQEMGRMEAELNKLGKRNILGL